MLSAPERTARNQPAAGQPHVGHAGRDRPGISAEMLLLDATALRACGIDALSTGPGYSFEAANVTIRHLIDAERAGKSCHGLVRLPKLVENGFGFERWDRPRPTHPADSLLVFDGTRRPGLYVLAVMMDEAIAVAKRTGICLAVGKNVYPSGHLGGYGLQAAEAGLVAHIESTSPSRVTAPGHCRPYVGTNPICRAFPTSGGLPVVIDLATSALTHGDLMMAEERGGLLPPGAAVRSDGLPALSVDEFDPAKRLGGILPFGQRDAYKAFALALGVALQTSYSGAPPASPDGATFGASVLLFDPERLDPAGHARRARWLSDLADAERVRIPGWTSVAALKTFELQGVVPVRRMTWNIVRQHLAAFGLNDFDKATVVEGS